MNHQIFEEIVGIWRVNCVQSYPFPNTCLLVLFQRIQSILRDPSPPFNTSITLFSQSNQENKLFVVFSVNSTDLTRVGEVSAKSWRGQMLLDAVLSLGTFAIDFALLINMCYWQAHTTRPFSFPTDTLSLTTTHLLIVH